MPLKKAVLEFNGIGEEAHAYLAGPGGVRLGHAAGADLPAEYDELARLQVKYPAPVATEAVRPRFVAEAAAAAVDADLLQRVLRPGILPGPPVVQFVHEFSVGLPGGNARGHRAPDAFHNRWFALKTTNIMPATAESGSPEFVIFGYGKPRIHAARARGRAPVRHPHYRHLRPPRCHCPGGPAARHLVRAGQLLFRRHALRPVTAGRPANPLSRCGLRQRAGAGHCRGIWLPAYYRHRFFPEALRRRGAVANPAGAAVQRHCTGGIVP
ncbi:unnamed protein product [Adineta ricciae]|uniref:Uncharacterized protein n=1 Tax=Adineta ricciae TaxID=249248 RepID=A0A814ID40_ADIRI|nr:unnamed protein product [Adineta ricciae]CAF1493410.1 unnamed protein product [Adineta ricciae]